MEIRWDRLTAPEIKAFARRDAVVLLPVAALEQHGPHLPVWTDSFIGHAACCRAAEGAAAEGLPVLVLPPLWTGLSEHHLPFNGTISLDHATFQAVLRCVCRSLQAQGFRKLFLVNSHGGNIESIAIAARELGVEFGMAVVATTIFHVMGEAVTRILTTQTGIRHACEGETSIWLALDPDQVRQEEIPNTISSGGVSNSGPFNRARSFAERAPGTGVLGDPRAATAEKGAQLLAAIAEGLLRGLRDASLWTVPDPVWERNRGLPPMTSA